MTYRPLIKKDPERIASEVALAEEISTLKASETSLRVKADAWVRVVAARYGTTEALAASNDVARLLKELSENA